MPTAEDLQLGLWCQRREPGGEQRWQHPRYSSFDHASDVTTASEGRA